MCRKAQRCCCAELQLCRELPLSKSPTFRPLQKSWKHSDTETFVDLVSLLHATTTHSVDPTDLSRKISVLKGSRKPNSSLCQGVSSPKHRKTSRQMKKKRFSRTAGPQGRTTRHPDRCFCSLSFKKIKVMDISLVQYSLSPSALPAPPPPTHGG